MHLFWEGRGGILLDTDHVDVNEGRQSVVGWVEMVEVTHKCQRSRSEHLFKRIKPKWFLLPARKLLDQELVWGKILGKHLRASNKRMQPTQRRVLCEVKLLLPGGNIKTKLCFETLQDGEYIQGSSFWNTVENKDVPREGFKKGALVSPYKQGLRACTPL